MLRISEFFLPFRSNLFDKRFERLVRHPMKIFRTQNFFRDGVATLENSVWRIPYVELERAQAQAQASTRCAIDKTRGKLQIKQRVSGLEVKLIRLDEVWSLRSR